MAHPDRGTGFEGIKNAIKVGAVVLPPALLTRTSTSCLGTFSAAHCVCPPTPSKFFGLWPTLQLTHPLCCLQDNLPGTDRHRHRNQDAGDNLKEAVPGTLNNQKATESTGEQVKRHIPGTQEHHAAYNEDMGDKVAKHIPGTDANKAAKVWGCAKTCCTQTCKLLCGTCKPAPVECTRLTSQPLMQPCFRLHLLCAALLLNSIFRFTDHLEHAFCAVCRTASEHSSSSSTATILSESLISKCMPQLRAF